MADINDFPGIPSLLTHPTFKDLSPEGRQAAIQQMSPNFPPMSDEAIEQMRQRMTANLESHRIGPVHQVANEWGEPGPLTQWINSPGILPSMLKGMLETGGLLPEPLGAPPMAIPQGRNIIPGLTEPIRITFPDVLKPAGQEAPPTVPLTMAQLVKMGGQAVGKALIPIQKFGQNVFEQFGIPPPSDVPQAIPRVTPEGFPDYLPPRGATLATPKYTPETYTPGPGATGYPTMERPGVPSPYPGTPTGETFTPGKVTQRNLADFTPYKQEYGDFSRKIIPRRWPMTEAGSQEPGPRTFIQNQDGSITEVKPVGESVIPKAGPARNPSKNPWYRANDAFHSVAQQQDLGPGVGEGVTSPGLLTSYAKAVGKTPIQLTPDEIETLTEATRNTRGRTLTPKEVISLIGGKK